MFFWLAIVVLVICCEIAVATEVHTIGLVGLAVIGAAIFFGIIPASGWVVAHPWTTLGLAVLYIALGVGWGFIKWYFHLLNVNDTVKQRDKDYRGYYARDKHEGETYYQYLISNKYIPLAINNKHLISVWMAWWPFSAMWTFIDDFVRRFYNWIINYCIAIFNSISAHVFKGIQ